ncbi:hypothetical protein PS673_05759 [Pseudomonas fluorescens]|uniref:Uncharacterized protein n=1 Tax=Pseudomonas fluorescens TaxID=294 RepID=A0A5E6XWU1_PSEFL|nr:hypothetical protein PS673_05759 [Pseudomonas fluorescens]
MRMKKLPVSMSSNCELSEMLHPLSERKPDIAATIPRVERQVTVRQYLDILISSRIALAQWVNPLYYTEPMPFFCEVTHKASQKTS